MNNNVRSRRLPGFLVLLAGLVLSTVNIAYSSWGAHFGEGGVHVWGGQRGGWISPSAGSGVYIGSGPTYYNYPYYDYPYYHYPYIHSCTFVPGHWDRGFWIAPYQACPPH